MPQKAHSFPWENVTANTLRNVCRDLGVTGHSHSRDEMRIVLQDIETRGLEAVLSDQQAHSQAKRENRRIAGPSKTASRPSARSKKVSNNEAEHDEASLSPRRSGREPRLTEKRRATLVSSSRPTARGRRGARPSSMASKKANFDGIVLPERRRSRVSIKAQEAEEGGAGTRPKSFAQLDADGDENMEVDGDTS